MCLYLVVLWIFVARAVMFMEPCSWFAGALPLRMCLASYSMLTYRSKLEAILIWKARMLMSCTGALAQAWCHSNMQPMAPQSCRDNWEMQLSYPNYIISLCRFQGVVNSQSVHTHSSTVNTGCLFQLQLPRGVWWNLVDPRSPSSVQQITGLCYFSQKSLLLSLDF